MNLPNKVCIILKILEKNFLIQKNKYISLVPYLKASGKELENIEGIETVERL